ncbi:MFS transporter [uncultured Tateyamaria sp.]|uniref:MFS transporter n=1 Tax=uncultured Tateyamaria sp. TaxID=455651 RepID=UPI002614118C|nr:MFS transporter [uncultured Tateyamaria sp.]
MTEIGAMKEKSQHMGQTINFGFLSVAIFSVIAAGTYTTLAGLLATKFIASGIEWDATSISIGIAVNMALYGLFSPFAVALMKTYGVRRVSVCSLGVLIASSLLCMIPNLLLFNVVWGVFIGAAVGAFTMSYAALIATTYFSRNIGLISGVLTAASVLGQFLLLPFWAEVSDVWGWRAPLLGAGSIALVALLLNLKYTPHSKPAGAVSLNTTVQIVVEPLIIALRHPAFWALLAVFFLCGATTNGLLWSHFTAFCGDIGLDATSASIVLALVGIFNVVGTTASGWLSDRFSARAILAFIFFGRGLTLFWLPLIITSEFDPMIATFGIVFGILDVATVPPVVLLCNRAFGDNGPVIFSWISAGHQIGAGFMALTGGIIRSQLGTYDLMWMIGGAFCILAATVSSFSRVRKQPYPA